MKLSIQPAGSHSEQAQGHADGMRGGHDQLDLLLIPRRRCQAKSPLRFAKVQVQRFLERGI